MKRIAITTGDPGGIGPEITTKAFSFFLPDPEIAYIIYGRLDTNNISEPVKTIDSIDQADTAGKFYHLPIKFEKVVIGKPTAGSGMEALRILDQCSKDLNSNHLDAIVTCPVSKEAIRLTDNKFIGHTEYLAETSGTDNVIMSFWGPHFNLALLTTHLSICDIANQLPRNTIKNKLRIIYKESEKYSKNNRFAILGFNPHAGENGAFGKEDQMIEEILVELADEGILIDGPFPADTFFTKKAKSYNFIISPYHDQGLIPFKMVSQNDGVNVTLGLPYVRTSVDHGTAYDIAGQGIASEESLISAIRKAEEMLSGNTVKARMQYNWFAEFYDTYMEHVDYDSWIEFIMTQYIKNRSSNPENILELACGTATISTKLVKKGLRVDASDMAPEMLKMAARKCFAPNLYCRDMLSPITANNYNLILLLFDSINYLLDSRDISTLFESVYKGLKKGGIFIFDISTLKNALENFDGYVNLDESDEYYMIHQSEFDDENSILTTSLTLFDNKSFLFKKKNETHRQKIYQVDEIVNFIEESKMSLISINAIDHPNNLKDFNGLDTSFNRLFFVLEK